MDVPGMLTRLLFPHACFGCGSDRLAAAEWICPCCYTGLSFTGFFDHAENPVRALFPGSVSAGAWLYFQPKTVVQQWVFDFKYRGNRSAAAYAGRMLAEAMPAGHFDAVIPVPLHPSRQRKRGYNQAELIALAFCIARGLSCHTGILRRSAPTISQTRQGRAQRSLNMGHVFEAGSMTEVRDKHVLLIDDVITTGATVRACMEALAGTPGIKISVAALAFSDR